MKTQTESKDVNLHPGYKQQPWPYGLRKPSFGQKNAFCRGPFIFDLKMAKKGFSNPVGPKVKKMD